MAARDDWTGIRRTPYGYLVQVRVRPFPLQSKRFSRDAALSDMQRWREDTQRRLTRIRPETPAAGTLEADVKLYLSEWGSDVHPMTRAQRRQHLALWCRAFKGRLRHTITTAEIRSVLAEWERQGLPIETKRKDRLSPAYINKIRQSLYQLYAYLDAGKGIPNPVAEVPTRTPGDPEPRAMDPHTARRILAAIKPGPIKARLYVMRYCGLRPEEVRRIRRTDWSRHSPGTLLVHTAKGGSAALLPLTPTGAAAMRYFDRWHAYGYFDTKDLYKPFVRAAERCGFGGLGLRPYDLRHTYGTELFRATHDIKVTQAGLRQKTIQMTMRYVQAAVSPVLESGVRALGQAERDRLRAARTRARTDRTR